MFDWFRQYGKSILFLSSAPIDEVWTRSTALACRRSGKRVQVIMCGNATEGGDHAVSLYRAAGIAARPFDPHTGEVLGIPGQTIAGLVSLGGCFLFYTGIALSWRRFRAWRARRAGVTVPSAVVELEKT